MIFFDKHTPQCYKNDRYHKGFTIQIMFYPGLIVPLILEQLRKGLKYRNAVLLKEPYWNGTDWEEYDGTEYFDDLPF